MIITVILERISSDPESWVRSSGPHDLHVGRLGLEPMSPAPHGCYAILPPSYHLGNLECESVNSKHTSWVRRWVRAAADDVPRMQNARRHLFSGKAQSSLDGTRNVLCGYLMANGAAHPSTQAKAWTDTQSRPSHSISQSESCRKPLFGVQTRLFSMTRGASKPQFEECGDGKGSVWSRFCNPSQLGRLIFIPFNHSLAAWPCII